MPGAAPQTAGIAFTTGIAVSIMSTQAADFLGIRADTPPPREFLEKIQWLWENLPHANPVNLAVAAACVGMLAFGAYLQGLGTNLKAGT